MKIVSIRQIVSLVMGIFSVALVGCSSDSSPTNTTEYGVPILRQEIDRSQVLALTENWRIGHSEDPQGIELFRVRDAAIGPDGETFIVEGGNHQIRVFDTDGIPLREFGGEGDGPGEFRSAGMLEIRNDTVLVSDRSNRVHFFDLDGTSLSTHQIRFEDGEVNSLSFVGQTKDHWFVSASGYFRGTGAELSPVRRLHTHFINPADGTLEPTEFRWSFPEEGEFSDIFWIQPILTHVAGGSFDGRGRFLLSDTASYRIKVLGLNGEEQLRIENEAVRRPIDDALIDLWKESRSCPFGTDGNTHECSGEADQLALSMERTEHRPFIRSIRTYPSGHFSVQRGDLDPNPFDSTSSLEYDYFDPDGEFLGSTSSITPHWFDGERLISVERDELSIESVASYTVGGR